MQHIFCKQLSLGDSAEVVYGFEWISMLKFAEY